MLKIANDAVEGYLNLKEFIELHKDTIYSKLEQREEHVTEAQGIEKDGSLLCAGNATFIAEGLALMSGIVSVGANSDNYESASKWIKEKFPKADDPTPIFLALTLMYVVNKGWKEANKNGSTERKVVWNRIHERMKAFSTSIGETEE